MAHLGKNEGHTERAGLREKDRISSAVGRTASALTVIKACKNIFQPSQVCAIFFTAFALLTAIFANVDIEKARFDFATFVRTILILCALGAILALGAGSWSFFLRIVPGLRLSMSAAGIATVVLEYVWTAG